MNSRDSDGDPALQPPANDPQQGAGFYLTREEVDRTLQRMQEAGDEQLASWAADFLSPEITAPPDRLLSGSLLVHEHAFNWVTALRELQGRLFFVTHHLHQSWVSIERALSFAEEAVGSVARHAWNAGGRRQCSWLNASASGHRPLALLVPEKDGDGRAHVHGFLHIPATIRVKKERLNTWLRVIPPRRQSTSVDMLHHDAVHLHEIHRWEVLRPYILYATKGWGPGDPTGQQLVAAPFGASVAADWEAVNRRMEQLEADRSARALIETHETALRTQALQEEGTKRRHEAAKKVTRKRNQKQRAPEAPPQRAWNAPPEPVPHRSYRNIAVVRRPQQPPEPPREADPTGPLDW